MENWERDIIKTANVKHIDLTVNGNRLYFIRIKIINYIFFKHLF